MREIVRILGTARHLWPLYLGIVAGAVVIAATTLLMPFVIARATDIVVSMATGGPGTIAALMWLAVALLVLSLVNSAVSNVTGYWGDLMAARLRNTLSVRYFHKLLRLPQRYYDNELTGTLISRLNRSITSITDFLQMFANNFFPMLITLVAVLIITLFYSPWLTLLLIIIYPTFVWLTALTSKRWQVWEHEKNEHYDVAGGRFAEVIAQMRVVKSFVTERREVEKFGAHFDDAVAITKQQSAFWHRMDTARRAVLDVVFFAIFAILFVQTAQGAFSIGVMVMLIQLVNMARQPVTSMSYLVDSTQRALAGSREYFVVISEIDEPNHALEAAPSTDTDWGDDDPVISFEGVDFAYDGGDTLVLEGIDLAINRGEKVAFVGESGGGKTTLVNLIMRLYPVTAGALEVHGRNVDDLPAEALRREIGVVFQDASLFSGTIAENIAYGIDGVTEEQLAGAAARANASAFVDRLPKRFDTEIGERGIKLSGGQKQRISVARALLKDAPILILDEATSSLDIKAERAVQAGLDELMEGRTTLIIAHRLSTIAAVDRIVTLRDGRIDEVGTPAELAATGGIYAELLALQSSSRKADKAKLARYGITR